MVKKIVILFAMVWTSFPLYAQSDGLLPPAGLMTDLIAQSDFQSIKGIVIPSSVENLKNKEVQSVLIGSQNPSFSWEMRDQSKNSVQSAYQIIVADNLKDLNKNIGNIWNSGKRISSKSSGVVADQIRLKPNAQYYWKVRVWNNHSEISSYAQLAKFYTGPLLNAPETPAYPLITQEQNPIKFSKRNAVYFADFGKDAFGQLKLNLFSAKDRDSVTIHLGESLNKDGSINRKPGGAIRYAKYVLALQKGLHTYHLKIKTDEVNTRAASIKMPAYLGEVTPFRYCEIENYDKVIQVKDLTRIAVHYKFEDQLVSFHSSDTLLNDIWELCKYSIKATSFAGIYVDGDRERIPYEADAYINQLSHYAVDKEFTLARRSHEYLIKHATWPTEWILQSVLMAWHDYLYTGDLQSVTHHYEDLKAKSLMSLADSTHLISTTNGKMSEEIKSAIHFNGPALKDIVDWPHSGILGVDKKEAGETDGFVFEKYNAVVNAYYYKSLTVMKSLAHDLGRIEDEKSFANEATLVYEAYQNAFFNLERGIYKDGMDTKHASLHSNMFALAFGLVKSQDLPEVLAFIKSRDMACSVYGSQFLLDAVYDANDGQYGLKLLTSKSERSWYNMIKVGSTITLEAWDNKYKPNQDWNHAWGAAPANIISRKLMGIEPLKPGWSNFSVKPQIDTLSAASIDVPTIKGLVSVAYQQDQGNFKIKITVPANTVAQIYLPFKKGKINKVWLDDKVMKGQRQESNFLSNLGSGIHHIKIEYNNNME